MVEGHCLIFRLKVNSFVPKTRGWMVSKQDNRLKLSPKNKQWLSDRNGSVIPLDKHSTSLIVKHS